MHFYLKRYSYSGSLFRFDCVKQKCKQMNLQWKFSLTCDRQLGSPPDHKVPKLQLARVIPNVIFSNFIDGQSVPPPLYRLSPLLWLAFLDLNKQKDTKHVITNVKKKKQKLSGHWRLFQIGPENTGDNI